MKNDNYHLGQLNGPVSQIDIQRNMVSFVVDGHILLLFSRSQNLLISWVIISYAENFLEQNL